jgi:hypothetical protein
MQLDFHFQEALGNGTIVRVLVETDDVKSHLEKELETLRVRTMSGSRGTGSR